MDDTAFHFLYLCLESRVVYCKYYFYCVLSFVRNLFPGFCLLQKEIVLLSNRVDQANLCLRDFQNIFHCPFDFLCLNSANCLGKENYRQNPIIKYFSDMRLCQARSLN